MCLPLLKLSTMLEVDSTRALILSGRFVNITFVSLVLSRAVFLNKILPIKLLSSMKTSSVNKLISCISGELLQISQSSCMMSDIALKISTTLKSEMPSASIRSFKSLIASRYGNLYGISTVPFSIPFPRGCWEL